MDRRNRSETLIAQAERRLRDAALELGPYGAERQQRAVEMALRDLRDGLEQADERELDLLTSQLEEALYGLNRRLTAERRELDGGAGPLEGIKSTLGSLKDELFAEDDWDDWERPGGGRGRYDRYDRSDDPWGALLSPTMDHWAVLGLEPGADAESLKQAFRRQARRWHPDLNGNDPAAEERFKKINEAYEVLSDLAADRLGKPVASARPVIAIPSPAASRISMTMSISCSRAAVNAGRPPHRRRRRRLFKPTTI